VKVFLIRIVKAAKMLAKIISSICPRVGAVVSPTADEHTAARAAHRATA
jgi:hypothetical protein